MHRGRHMILQETKMSRHRPSSSITHYHHKPVSQYIAIFHHQHHHRRHIQETSQELTTSKHKNRNSSVQSQVMMHTISIMHTAITQQISTSTSQYNNGGINQYRPMSSVSSCSSSSCMNQCINNYISQQLTDSVQS